MTLFGKKHNDVDNVHNPNAQYDAGMSGVDHQNRLTKDAPHQHHHNDPMYPSPNAPSNMQGGPMSGAGAGAGAGNFGPNSGLEDPGLHHRAAGPGGAAGGAGHGNDTGYGNDAGYGGAAPGAATGGMAAQHPMRPQTDAHGNPMNPGATGHGGGGQRMQGKIEHAVGTLIGSQSLKAKGLAKEQESAALKAQAAELTEAERLEQIALARRERAVAHGAHPDHKHLGGHNPGAGAPNLNELGGGANYGVTGAGGASSGARGGY